MSRHLSPSLRLRIMRSIRSQNTRPELLLYAAARQAFTGLKIVRHATDLPGRPDLYLPGLRLALFCDGCLFHGCRKHCRIPTNNREYWIQKIRRNRSRDRRVRAATAKRYLDLVDMGARLSEGCI